MDPINVIEMNVVGELGVKKRASQIESHAEQSSQLLTANFIKSRAELVWSNDGKVQWLIWENIGKELIFGQWNKRLPHLGE